MNRSVREWGALYGVLIGPINWIPLSVRTQLYISVVAFSRHVRYRGLLWFMLVGFCHLYVCWWGRGGGLTGTLLHCGGSMYVCACMRVCLFVILCACVYVYVYVCACVCVCVSVRVLMRAHGYVLECLCMQGVWIHGYCVFPYVCECTCACICVYVCVHINQVINSPSIFLFDTCTQRPIIHSPATTIGALRFLTPSCSI